MMVESIHEAGNTGVCGCLPVVVSSLTGPDILHSLSACSSALISFFPFSFFPGSFAAEVRKKSRGLLPTTWREAECLPLLLLLWTDFESCPFGLHTWLSAIRRPKCYLLIFRCYPLAFLRWKYCLCIWNWKPFFCVWESGCTSLEVLLSVGDLSVFSLFFLYIQVKNSNTFAFGAVSPILPLVLLCCR